MDPHDAILSRLLDLHPKKIDLSLGRIERLLEAMGRLRLVSGLRLWVLGKGNVGRARLQAERLGIVDRVHFPGVVTDPERWMAAADLFVLPTIYDPFSNACLEAMACGLPVATTRANV